MTSTTATTVLPVRDRINLRLSGQPWNVVPAQRPDFAAWLCGLDEGAAQSLLDLSQGEAESVEARLISTIDPARLMYEWVGARHAARNLRTVEQLNEEAAAWLR